MACDPSVYNGTTNWGEQIGCLKKEIEELKNEIKSVNETASEFSTTLGGSANVMTDLLNTIGDMRKRMYEFTHEGTQQYQLAESIAKSYKEAALQIGLSVGRAKGFNEAFKGSVAAVAKFGGDISDVQGIYQDFIEESGRVRILGEDEVENIFKLGKAANLVGSEATSLYESFELMGVSNVSATERMEKLIIDSQKIGLNSSKVVKTLSSNMKTMQQYSFANGVKGMTEMAKLAVKMRLDVGEMLNMSDKFYEPEAAIEAAANLQMLGGDIAKAFGDPFETMYLARNKPEELAKKVGGMVENMMTFNEVTKEYEFPPEARMQLKAAGDQLGINVDSMIEMSRQASKMKDIKDKLSIKGMFSEEEMEGIASMSRLEDGQFKVDVYDEEGIMKPKSLDELTAGDVEMLMKMPQDEKDYQSQMIYESMTTNEILKSIEDTFQKTFVKGFDMYQIIEDSSKKTMEATRDMTMASVTASLDFMKNSIAGKLGGTGKDFLEETDAAMAKYIGSMTDFISKDADLDVDVENGVINVLGVTGGFNPSAGGTTGTGGVTTSNPSVLNNQNNSSIPTNTGLIQNNGNTNNNNMVNTASNNVIVPTVPSTINSKVDFGELVISGKIEVVSQGNTLSSVDLTNIKPELEKMIITHLNGTYRNGGVPSSKQSIGII
jgi:hypothetical protein